MSALASYLKLYADEAPLLSEPVRLLSQGGDFASRRSFPLHVTAGALLVRGAEILLVEHRAYGIILQAIELLTALALGVPALLREGMTWQDIRRGRIEQDAQDEVEANGAQARGTTTKPQASSCARADPEARSKPAPPPLS